MYISQKTYNRIQQAPALITTMEALAGKYLVFSLPNSLKKLRPQGLTVSLVTRIVNQAGLSGCIRYRNECGSGYAEAVGLHVCKFMPYFVPFLE